MPTDEILQPGERSCPIMIPRRLALRGQFARRCRTGSTLAVLRCSNDAERACCEIRWRHSR
jgi:hypothetical protein